VRDQKGTLNRRLIAKQLDETSFELALGRAVSLANQLDDRWAHSLQ
jgi:hypothetical protein